MRFLVTPGGGRTGEKVTVTITEEVTDIDPNNVLDVVNEVERKCEDSSHVMYLVVIGVLAGTNIVLVTIIGVMCWRMKKKEIINLRLLH